MFTRKKILLSTFIAIAMTSVIAGIIIFLRDNTALSPGYNKATKTKRPVILDPGHGGAFDSGAVISGIHEDEIVYDISIRIRRLLLNRGYTVRQTLFDSDTGFKEQGIIITNNKEFLKNHNGKAPVRNSKLARCSLINSFYNPKDDPILISLHVNVVPSFIQGASIYYPNFQKYGSHISTRKSRKLAEIINFTLETLDIPTYTVNLGFFNLNLLSNVREDFFRGPDFKFYLFEKTKIKTKILIECGNLKNREDRMNLSSPEWREHLAYAIFKGIIQYNSSEP